MSEHSTSIPLAGDQAVLAQRYIGALYALAEEDKAVEVIAADMYKLQQLWDQSADWRLAATDPRFDAKEVGAAAVKIAPLLGLHSLTAHLLGTLAEHLRLSLLPALAVGFLSEVIRRRGEYHADIRTARALSKAQSDALSASLTSVAGGKVHLSVTEDTSLLGGLTIQLGSQFIDASIKTKLDHLERTLKGAV